MTSEKSLPAATYRIQLTKDFTFDDAARVAPYLHRLGVTHLYLSPIFESTPGSTHGYDVMDFSKISEERGGEAGFDKLNKLLETFDPPLKIILDIVPNHMSSSPANPYWRDVLKNGRDSKYWGLFDLRLGDDEKIELPVLGEAFEEIIHHHKLDVEKHDQEKLHLTCQGASYPLCQDSHDLHDENVDEEKLKRILDKQHYKFVHWTKASRKISYRRFFNITDLIGVRVEDDAMYQLGHARLFELMQKYPAITGIRVDHIDGLADPAGYLQKLREKAPHIWVEKIVAYEENLVPSWPVEGTTGYEFVARLNDLLVDSKGFAAIEKFWVEETAPRWNGFDTCVKDSKQEALENLFPFEMKRLVTLTANGDPQAAKKFWTDLSVALPVYRTYWTESGYAEDDVKWIDLALEKFCLDQNFNLDDMLLHPRSEQQKKAIVEWQQLSGPAMAKGLEDTAHYRFTPLVALNEVGCEAITRDNSPQAFFDWLQKRGEHWPACLNATSTHDTKRAEDVRHRLYALADLPERWIEFYKKIKELAVTHRETTGLKDPAAEYLLVQTIIGSWPFDNNVDDVYIGRIQAYMAKAIKETKTLTSWTEPDEAYEQAIGDFVASILKDKVIGEILSEFAEYISWCGALNSLTVQTLKILSPGVPDIYNGTEIWNLSLVDPDNRRPVDFDRNIKYVDQFAQEQDRQALLKNLTGNWRNGAIKIWLTQQLNQARQQCFTSDDILKANYINTGTDSVLAYRLSSAKSTNSLVILLPRFPGKLAAGDFENLTLAKKGLDIDIKLDLNGVYENLITLQPFDMSNPIAVLQDFPVAILREKRNAD